MSRIQQHGFEAVAVIITMLFVGVVGFAGYKVVSLNKSAEVAQSTAATDTSAPATIKTTADLAQTNKALDASNSQLNTQLDDSSLDSDLNATL